MFKGQVRYSYTWLVQFIDFSNGEKLTISVELGHHVDLKKSRLAHASTTIYPFMLYVKFRLHMGPHCRFPSPKHGKRWRVKSRGSSKWLQPLLHSWTAIKDCSPTAMSKRSIPVKNWKDLPPPCCWSAIKKVYNSSTVLMRISTIDSEYRCQNHFNTSHSLDLGQPQLSMSTFYFVER